MKLLRAIHFDQSDLHVFNVMANPDEVVVSGAFEFALLDKSDIKGKLKQAFANGFLGTETLGRATFAVVSLIDQGQYETAERNLVRSLIRNFGAPDQKSAEQAAQDELMFAQELCEEALINTVFTVRRYFDDQEEIREEFRTIQPPSDQPVHSKIWSIIDDEA